MVLVACAATPAPPGTFPPTSPFAPTTTVVVTTTPVRGDLADWEPVTALLGDRELVVALADEERERKRGLTGIRDFGGFDGMLFAWDEEVTTGFWTKDTLVALDLFFFDGNGALVDQTTLEPCVSEPCPYFVADSLFRWALEAPAGTLPPPGPTDLLTIRT